ARIREDAVDHVVRQAIALGEVNEGTQVDGQPVQSSAGGADPEEAVRLARIGEERAYCVVTQARWNARIVAVMPERRRCRIEPHETLIRSEPECACCVLNGRREDPQ